MKRDTKSCGRCMPSHAKGTPTSVIRIAFLAAFIGGIMSGAASPLHAQSTDDNSDQQQQMMMEQSAPSKHMHSDKMTAHGPEAMARHVEERIKSLHDKLGITSEQEAKWADVAQTMRDNEAAIAALIDARHKNAEGMTALDDLQSYEDITQAHADGLKKLISVFHDLYGDMPADQQKKADKIFGSFEGHGKPAMKHK